MQLFYKKFLAQLTRMCIKFIVNFIENIGTQFAKPTYQIVYHLYMFVFMVCITLKTQASLWRHKGVVMHVTRKTVHRLFTMHDSSPAA